MILQSDFHALTLDLQDIFNEGAAAKIAANKGFTVFNVADTMRRSYIHQVLHGVAGIQRVTPGQDLPKINSQEGDQATWTQEYFGADFSVTKEARKFDLYDEITGLAQTLVDSAFDDVDQSFADVLSKGWLTSYTDVFNGSVSGLTPDGVALFSASHSNPITSVTYSNIITDGTNTNPALSRAAIVYMRRVGLTYKDPNSKTRPVNYDTLIVSPANEDLAYRIVNSDQMSGTASNDTNPLKGKIKNIIVWERLDTASDGTDTSAYWYLADSSKMKESLQAKFSERPTLDPPDQAYLSKNWDYTCDFFYTIGRGFPAYVAGAKGDNS